MWMQPKNAVTKMLQFELCKEDGGNTLTQLHRWSFQDYFGIQNLEVDFP